MKLSSSTCSVLPVDDGDEDVIVCNNVGAPFFYQYQQKEPNNWIRVRAVHQ